LKHTFFDFYSGLASPIHSLDARLKAVVTFCFVLIIVSTPPRAYGAFAGYAAFLAAVLLLSRLPVGFILKRFLLLLPCLGLVAVCIPFMPAQGALPGSLIFWNLLAKALLGALAGMLLAATTPFPDLLAALEQLRLPRRLILIASFAYRYVFVLVDETERMLRARDSRCYSGRWLWQAAVIGRMIGTLFLRSYERGERVYLAMLARGFDGAYPQSDPAPLKRRDCFCACGAFALLLALRLCSL
jgi:cobalt/nickel transport system permease protein